MKRKKILILMSSVAGGHKSVAEALGQAFEEGGHEVVVFDAFPFLKNPYGIFSRHLLDLWAFLYWTSNTKRVSEMLAKLGNKLVAKKVATEVLREIPDFVISDYPFITKIPKEVFKRGMHVPLGVVVVDPVSAHTVWFRGNPDVYFIPTDYIEKMALRAGVPKEKIVLTGYPVRKEFYKKENIFSLRTSLRLEPSTFTIMIGGSSEGVGKIPELCKRLARLPGKYKFQAVVVCGKNKVLFKKLIDKYYEDIRFKILPFERHMADYVKACDVIVSKAGPTHLYEAVAARKPFVAFSYIPGQEEGNLDLIRKKKIGIVEENIHRVVSYLKRGIKNPEILESFIPHIDLLRRIQRRANLRVVRYVERHFLS